MGGRLPAGGGRPTCWCQHGHPSYSNTQGERRSEKLNIPQHCIELSRCPLTSDHPYVLVIDRAERRTGLVSLRIKYHDKIC